MKNLRIYYRILAFLTAVFLVIYPFISYMHVRKATGIELEYFAKKSKVVIDFFFRYKENALLSFAIFMVVAAVLWLAIYHILYERLPERLLCDRKDKRTFFVLAAYFLLNVISVLFSKYREYGLFGLSIDYEGLAAIFSYMALFALGYFLFREKRTSRMLLWALRLLMALLILGAFLEMSFGMFANVGWFRDLFSSDRYAHLLDNSYWKEPEGVSLTFGNPGFFGGFCGMLLPVSIGIAVTDKKRFVIGDILLAGGMIFCILMSASTGALYAAVAAVALELSYLWGRAKRLGWGDGRKQEGNMWKKAGSAASVSLVCGLLLLSAAQKITGDGELFRERIGGTVINAQYEKKEGIFQVERIQLVEGKVVAEGETGTFTAEVLEEKDDMSLSDFSFTGEEGVSLEAMGRILTVGFGYNDPVKFYAYDGHLYYIDFNGSLLEEIPQPKMKSLEKIYPLFTGRGYIWASSIPIAMDSLIIGKGIGAFPFYYPQSEVAGMLDVHGSADYCIEQAHSWYLQTAVGSGALSLFCMLYAMFAVFFKQIGWGMRHKKEEDKMDVTGAADESAVTEWTDFLVWGLIAYAVAGTVNNSSVSATPIFWLLLGAAAYRASASRDIFKYEQGVHS